MVDVSQIFIIAAITVMTIILSIIGVQLIVILKDFRIILRRVNNISEQIEKIGFNIGQGYSEVIGFVSGVKKLLMVVDQLSEKKRLKHGKK